MRRVIAHTHHEGGKWILNNGLLPPKPAAILLSDGLVFDFKMRTDPPIRHWPMQSMRKIVASKLNLDL